ncbi:methyl-cpg-binding domain-containing protein 9 [Phtheirospermum japonicum]|uniref:Methyl-cpg-binding domain-containing protein 9 n=1 Tax=Phtheirospermum japonicum TaxID=374723 RepID=A0A830D8L6_9LAMI|nr:methyl-cpg-binding domain-containing protein 9 [Phtheirospermum japonicum]
MVASAHYESRFWWSALQDEPSKHLDKYSWFKPNTKLTPSTSGDVLDSWQFLRRFREVLDLQKGLSLEELITGLNGSFSDGLYEVHIVMLQVLISEFLKKSKHGIKSGLNVPLLNDLTWPELAKRYISAMLFMTKDPNNSDKACKGMDIFRCLCGDGGSKCGALTGVVGIEADALLLAASTNKIYGLLNADSDMLAVDDLDTDRKNTGRGQSTVLNEGIPDWVQDLELVKGLKTNNGAKIRKCIKNSLAKEPPAWARDKLNQAISKEVYKGNASGPTKKLAKDVVAQFHDEHRNLTLTRNKKFISIFDVVMKHCRIKLRCTAASRKMKSFCSFLKKDSVGHGNNNKGLLGSPVKVWSLLHLRMIDMRLAAGAYCRSHEAFIEDVREFWRDVHIDFPGLSEFAKEASDEFERSCIKEVVSLHRKLKGYNELESLCVGSLKDIDVVINEEIPKAPWDEGVCRICGLDQYNNKDVEDVSPGATSSVCEKQKKKNGEFVSLIVSTTADLEAMVRGKEYWELNLHERTLLLEFLCEEMLDSILLQEHLTKCESRQRFTSIDSQSINDIEGSSLRTEFMGIGLDGSEVYSLGACYQSHAAIKSIVASLKDNDPIKSRLQELISLNDKPGFDVPKDCKRQGQKGVQSNPMPLDSLKEKATKGLGLEYDPFIKLETTDFGKKNKGKVVEENLYMCGSLEPGLPKGQHCPSCHRTCLTTMEYKLRGNEKCNIDSRKLSISLTGGKTTNSVASKGKFMNVILMEKRRYVRPDGLEIGNFFNVPTASLRPLMDKSSVILNQLKTKLLNMEAAISKDHLKPSRAGFGRRRTWRLFVKHASTIYAVKSYFKFLLIDGSGADCI